MNICFVPFSLHQWHIINDTYIVTVCYDVITYTYPAHRDIQRIYTNNLHSMFREHTEHLYSTTHSIPSFPDHSIPVHIYKHALIRSPLRIIVPLQWPVYNRLHV